ncbi:MAG TPA: Ni/Fe hydrogenase subunit alpha [Terracidiphilus sp.]|nr:Ni/Fe hydrogenase subunit alpha [Terracidiphilus sp.]
MQTIRIDGITRVEGHGRITIQLDDHGQVEDAHLHVLQFRGFEKFCEGRPFYEMPSLTARICGICPVSHLLAGAKACDAIMGLRIPEAAEMLRRIVHLAQITQSHALSFFHLSSPDFLMGWDSDPAERNVLGLAQRHPDLALSGIRLRKWGQQVIDLLGGRRIHNPWIVHGGVSRPLTAETRDEILRGIPDALAIAQRTLVFFKHMMEKLSDEVEVFGNFPTMFMAIGRKDGNLCLYGSRRRHEGWLRFADADGNIVADNIHPRDYQDYVGEAVDPSSYMKAPYYKPLGYPDGIYRVGPAARLNMARQCGTPLADEALNEFRSVNGEVSLSSFHNHYARLIEIIFAIERMEQILQTPGILDTDIRAEAKANEPEGVGIIEAPRGTLIHHYKVDSDGMMTSANLIVATAHNTLAMNRGLKQVAHAYLSGHDITEGLLNRMEGLIRSFDPCLSCATHADGAMDLVVDVVDAGGNLQQRIAR